MVVYYRKRAQGKQTAYYIDVDDAVGETWGQQGRAAKDVKHHRWLREAARQTVPNYRPLVLRSAFLGTIGSIVILLISLLIVGFHVLPTEKSLARAPGKTGIEPVPVRGRAFHDSLNGPDSVTWRLRELSPLPRLWSRKLKHQTSRPDSILPNREPVVLIGGQQEEATTTLLKQRSTEENPSGSSTSPPPEPVSRETPQQTVTVTMYQDVATAVSHESTAEKDNGDDIIVLSLPKNAILGRQGGGIAQAATVTQISTSTLVVTTFIPTTQFVTITPTETVWLSTATDTAIMYHTSPITTAPEVTPSMHPTACSREAAIGRDARWISITS